MQVTVTVTDKLIKSAITNALDNEVYEHWDSATLKAAKAPKIATVVKEIFTDPKFQAQLAKEIQATSESAVEDYIYEMMDEIQIPQIVELGRTIERVAVEQDLVLETKRELAEVERMIKLLAKAGYKIEKA